MYAHVELKKFDLGAAIDILTNTGVIAAIVF